MWEVAHSSTSSALRPARSPGPAPRPSESGGFGSANYEAYRAPTAGQGSVAAAAAGSARGRGADRKGADRAARRAAGDRRARCGQHVGDGEVRHRAGWVVSAIRQGWDLRELLAERRQLEARYARWNANAPSATVPLPGGVPASPLRRAGGQRCRIGGAQRPAACRRGRPGHDTGRRAGAAWSLPVVRAQLLACSVSRHLSAPTQRLSEVVAVDLAGLRRTVAATVFDGPLRPVPRTAVSRKTT
jgi:hypothetical protein